MTRKNALTFQRLSYLLEEAASLKKRLSSTTAPETMTSIQLFHSRDCPGNTLHANILRALENLDRNIPVEQVEAGPEHDGGPLPALAVNGRIVVSGVEPTVRDSAHHPVHGGENPFLTPRSYKRGMGRLPGGPCSGSQASMRCGGKPPWNHGLRRHRAQRPAAFSSPYARSR